MLAAKRNLILGSLLGAGLLWLTTTKKGREVRGQALDHAAEVYERVKTRVQESPAWDKMSKSKFADVVNEVADEYSNERNVSDTIKRIVVRVVNSQWGNLAREKRKRR